MTLRQVAKECKEYFGDYISHVVIWKEGKSWYFTGLYLDMYNNSVQEDDIDEVVEILYTDIHAIVLNAHNNIPFGKYTIAELAIIIKRHYLNGCDYLIEHVPGQVVEEHFIN